MEAQGNAIVALMEETRREIAILTSDMLGTQTFLGQFGSKGLNRHELRRLRDLVESSPLPFMAIDPRPGLRILDINDAFAVATLSRRNRAAGDKLFNVFPDNPADPAATGVRNLYESLQTATRSGRTHSMAVQRYDVRDNAGCFVQRHWRPTNIPIFDDSGRLLYLLHYSETVSP